MAQIEIICMYHPFKSASVPYNFTTSNSIGSYYGMNKISSVSETKNGRGGVITIGQAEFYFMLNDVNADEKPIKFKQTQNDISINDLQHFKPIFNNRTFCIK